jgi:hypothetical protein
MPKVGLMAKSVLATALVLGAALLSSAPAAQASTYLFTGSLTQNGPTVVTLDIATGGSAGAGFAITGVTGTVLGDAVTLLGNVAVPPSFNTSPDGEWYYDNVLYPASNSPYGTVFDNPGLLVLNTVTNTDVNIFSPGNGAPYILGQSPNQQQENLFGSLAATPLPSTWMMLIGGFVGLGFFAYRGTKRSVAAIAAA